jgi:hypothetical protein
MEELAASNFSAENAPSKIPKEVGLTYLKEGYHPSIQLLVLVNLI